MDLNGWILSDAFSVFLGKSAWKFTKDWMELRVHNICLMPFVFN